MQSILYSGGVSGNGCPVGELHGTVERQVPSEVPGGATPSV